MYIFVVLFIIGIGLVIFGLSALQHYQATKREPTGCYSWLISVVALVIGGSLILSPFFSIFSGDEISVEGILVSLFCVGLVITVYILWKKLK